MFPKRSRPKFDPVSSNRNLKTLRELWAKYGKNKYRQPHWRWGEWYMMVGVSPGMESIGFLDNGKVIGYDISVANWHIVDKPKGKPGRPRKIQTDLKGVK